MLALLMFVITVAICVMASLRFGAICWPVGLVNQGEQIRKVWRKVHLRVRTEIPTIVFTVVDLPAFMGPTTATLRIVATEFQFGKLILKTELENRIRKQFLQQNDSED